MLRIPDSLLQDPESSSALFRGSPIIVRPQSFDTIAAPSPLSFKLKGPGGIDLILDDLNNEEQQQDAVRVEKKPSWRSSPPSVLHAANWTLKLPQPLSNLPIKPAVAIIETPIAFYESKTNSYPCKWEACRCVFANEHDLRVHFSMHQSRRPHACRRCKAAFVRSADLERHISKLHRVPRGGYRIKR